MSPATRSCTKYLIRYVLPQFWIGIGVALGIYLALIAQ